jgi:aspartyl-tRNA(Asn)/glutamyl-tRNA(Gln) amidotransferase subunit A
MPGLSRSVVRTLLAIQDFHPPEEELTEVTLRLNTLVEGLTTLENLDVFQVEPWTALPAPPLKKRTGIGKPSPEAESAHTDEIAFMTIAEQARLIRTKQLSPVALVQRYLDRIDRYDPFIHSFNFVMRDEALAAAKEAETEIGAGRYRGPLHGIPVAMKDQWDIKGVPNTGGCDAFADNIPDKDCTMITRLRAAGAIILGTTATHEFHMGGTIEFLKGLARNPWDLDKTPAGSSSGSGSSVAAGLVSAAIGGDTGGSIRGPASVNGISGLRPSWSRVSRQGGFALTWELDAPGPLTRSAEDCALVLQAIAGYDPLEPMSSREPVPDYSASLTGNIKGLKVAVFEELLNQMKDAEGRKLLDDAVDVLRGLGASVDTVSIPMANKMQGVQAAISDGYSASYHRKWLREKYDLYDRNTRVRIMVGTILPTGLQTLARRARVALGMEVIGAFEKFDILVGATMTGPAGPAQQKPVTNRKEALDAVLTRGGTSNSLSSAGVPAISVPAGLTSKGMPIGFQLAAAPMDEATLFRVSHAFQQATKHHELHPPMPWAEAPAK